MAKVTNRTRVPVEVFGTVGGAPQRWMLPPGHATDASFECTAVRATEGGTLFNSTDWWEPLCTQAVIYTFEENRFSRDDLSMHNFPFLPFAGTVTAGALSPLWDPGYRKLANPDTTITIPLDPNLALYEVAPDPSLPELEYCRSRDPDHAHQSDGIKFNEQFGCYVRTGAWISVRLLVLAFPTLKQEKVDIAAEEWKAAIELAWNQGYVPIGIGEPLKIEVEFTPNLPHYAVYVPPKFNFWRASYFFWPIDMDQGGRLTSAHEFGHHLGLQDEYVYEGELPHLKSELTMFTKWSGKTVNPSFTANLLSLFDVNHDRAKARTVIVSNPPQATLMESSSTGVIDYRLLNAIHFQKVQPLTLTERHVQIAERDAYFRTEDRK